MRRIFSRSNLHTVLTGFGTALVLIVVSSSAAGSTAASPSAAGGSGFTPEFFDGGGYGSTAETAVRQAIGDAETTASAYGLYTCELVGEPAVFQQPPGSLRAFRAQVRLHCTP